MARYGWSEAYCWTGIPTAKSRVYDNLAREQEMTLFGTLWFRKSPGYVRQEANKLLEAKLNGGPRQNKRRTKAGPRQAQR